MCPNYFWITFPRPARLMEGQQLTELFPGQVRMNRHMELKFQVECLRDVAVVNCSGRMVRGAGLDEFRRRIEQLERVRVLVRRWAMQKSAKMKLVNPPVFFRRMLEATRLNSVFEISSLKEAICILRSQKRPPRFAVA